MFSFGIIAENFEVLERHFLHSRLALGAAIPPMNEECLSNGFV